MSVDMGLEGLRSNRNFLRNSARPDFVLLTNDSMTDMEIEEFYNRWEARHRGPGNANRPAIASFVRDIKTLGFSHREMDFIQGLRWSLEEVSRVYGVPKPLLSDLERATFSNINASERIFWRNTMLPELGFLEEQLNRMLLPRFGYPDLEVKFDIRNPKAIPNLYRRQTALTARHFINRRRSRAIGHYSHLSNHPSVRARYSSRILGWPTRRNRWEQSGNRTNSTSFPSRLSTVKYSSLWLMGQRLSASPCSSSKGADTLPA
jgi:hypothetical protein